MRQVSPLVLSTLIFGAALGFACQSDRPRGDGGTDGAVTDGGMDAPSVDAPPADAGTDSPVPDASADAGCGLTCPPEMCIGGVCVDPFCCETGFCPTGYICDWESSCSCIPATGCCAGEACGAGEICSHDCRCISESDCCEFGCAFPESCDYGTCGCYVDTSCGPSCDGDRVCIEGECAPRCWFEPCADPTHVCSDAGCVPPACTEEECLLGFDPPQMCDPGSGCFDPCLGEDWAWCESLGGHCLLGQCVDDSCLGGTLACDYYIDCCGNWQCWDTSMPEPPCDPSWCGPEPRIPPRPDLCRCATYDRGGVGGYCADLWGGGIIIFPGPPPPPRPE
jgi:hypothetical protein